MERLSRWHFWTLQLHSFTLFHSLTEPFPRYPESLTGVTNHTRSVSAESRSETVSFNHSYSFIHSFIQSQGTDSYLVDNRYERTLEKQLMYWSIISVGRSVVFGFLVSHIAWTSFCFASD